MTANVKKKVLIVDDDRDACDLIRETLAPRGFDVFSCADPDEAAAMAGEIDPDLVFISILFPQSNGLKISKTVHAVGGLDKVPVIMLISYPDELDPRYTSTIGIVDVALKPLKPEDILLKTVSVLGEGTEPREIEEAAGAVSGPEEAASLDEEWLSFLEKDDLEPIEPKSRETGQGVSAGEEIHKTAGETEDFPPEEKRDGQVSEAAEEAMHEFAAESKGGPMKKFFAVAVSVLVLVAGAAAGAFLFFHGTQRKAAVTNVKAPVKKEQTVATQEKEAVSPAKRDKEPSGTALAKVESPAATQAVVDKSKAQDRAAGNSAKHAAKDKKVYSVQVGAFRNEKNAVALSEKMKKKGYDGFIIKENGSTVQRVLIGKFDAPGKAAVQAKLILEKEGLKSIIYHY